MRLRKCWIPPNSAQGRRVWRGGRPQKQALLHPLRSIQGSCCWTVISSPASTQQRIHWIPKYELFPRSDMRIRGHATMSSLSFLHYLHYIIAVVCPHHHIMHDVRTHTHTHTLHSWCTCFIITCFAETQVFGPVEHDFDADCSVPCQPHADADPNLRMCDQRVILNNGTWGL